MSEAIGAPKQNPAAMLAHASDLLARADDAQRQARELLRGVNLLRDGINAAVAHCHAASRAAGWWRDMETGESLITEKTKPLKLLLMHSEITEAMEAERRGLQDDKLPHRPGAEVELADLLIRVFDYAGAYGYDLGGAVVEKLAYNATRADHKPEARAAAGGKKF